MKMKLMVSEQNYANVMKELIEKGIEIEEYADYVLMEQNAFCTFLIGKKVDEIYRLKTSDIIRIESFAHDVIAYVAGEEYRLSERLKNLTEMLDPKDFIRVSNSAIISVNHIKSIKPLFTQKFIVTMSDGAKVDVTRSYYYLFKEFLGI